MQVTKLCASSDYGAQSMLDLVMVLRLQHVGRIR
ncbi:hypothetical protein ANAPH2_00159 [Anaplasma phagocytophilum]|nr:hypothetical protein ANAPH2_00159 [Anaplasma phagocytophilum]